ncbi:MAG: type IV pilus assembly protein PilM [Nitrospirae bacterium]|nr:type IV pilus assembly protein PilM [Nitrospirota bacterium]
MGVSLLSWVKPKRHLLGLDIGKSAIKVIQLASTRQGLVLKYAGLTELPPADRDEREGQDRDAPLSLHDVFKETRLKRQKIAINFSGRSPVIRYLLLPKMPKDELGEAVRWEAKKLIPFPMEDSVLDYLIVGETQERDLQRMEVLVVAAERSAVLNQLESFKRINLPITAMDVNPLALFNTLKLNYKSDLDENLVFVDIGAGKMDINISKRGVLRFTRNVQLGGDEITQAVMRGLGVEREEAEQLKRQKGLSGSASGGPAPEGPPGQANPPKADQDGRLYETIKAEADRMILETQRSMDYYRAQFREGSVKKIVLMGGACLMPGFQEYFASYFDANVELDDPFAEILCDEKEFGEIRLMAPRFSTAVGLALREPDA